MGDEMMVAPTAGATVRQEFGAQQVVLHAETAGIAMAAQQKAAVEARRAQALMRPRDWDNVRVELRAHCKRPGFARTARYHKPVGDGIEGPSIRFAEAALLAMTNVMPEQIVILDDAHKRIVRVCITELQNNVTYSKDIVVEKTVERTRLRQGQVAISSRQTAGGHTAFLVTATEDEMLNKEGALASKALRTLALRLLPGDILEECMDVVTETLQKEVATDPDAERKRLVDAFFALGVMPPELVTYLGHPLTQVTPHEIVALRAVYAAIKDGEATWAETLEHKTGAAAKKTGADEPPKTLSDLTKQRKQQTETKEEDHGA